MDILVAGTSCVDFSSLNPHNKSLADGGESDLTFHAFIKYIARYRPAICILENVRNADWDDIKAILTNNWEKAKAKVRNAYKNIWKDGDEAYVAEVAKVDTKDYYIPHTRSRGYLIAIDPKRYADAENAVKIWAQKMEELKRQASSPAECFLSEDVPESPPRPKLKARGSTDSTWAVCFASNQKTRMEFKIGPGRPLTRWVSGGSCVGPDHWDLAYVRSLPERVWDVFDICHLLHARDGFDDCYKT